MPWNWHHNYGYNGYIVVIIMCISAVVNVNTDIVLQYHIYMTYLDR